MCSAAAMAVCRQWRQLAASPQLLRTVDAHLGGQDQEDGSLLWRLQSLSQWLLARAAGHMRRLSLGLWVPVCYGPEGLADKQAASLNAELASLLTGCGRAAAEAGRQPLLEVELSLCNLPQSRAQTLSIE